MRTGMERLLGVLAVILPPLALTVLSGASQRVAGTAVTPCASTEAAVPSGLVVVIESKPGKAAADLRALENPSIRGVALQIHWSDLEPTQGAPDWSALDQLFAAADSAGKWVQLLMFPGFFTPAWALERVRTVEFPLQYGPGAGTIASLPIPWNEVYLTRWCDFLKRVSNRYSKRPSFRVVAADGPTSVSAETTLPTSAPDLHKWQAVGYTPTKYVSAWQQVLAEYASDFPNQCVSISGGRAAGVAINDQGKLDPQGHIGAKQAQAIVDQAMRVLGRRLVLQLSDVHGGPGPHVASSEGEDQYIIDQIGRVLTGFQLRTSAERGSAVMGAPGDPVLALRKSLDLALEPNRAGRHVDYVEIYEADVLADHLQPVLQDAAARFAHK